MIQTTDHYVTQFFFGYMIFAFGVYTILNLLALYWLRRNSDLRDYLLLETRLTGHEPGVSIIVPAFNEGVAIVSSVRSLLQQEFGDFEVIVVNDGSNDATLKNLQAAFELYPFPHAYCMRFETQSIRAVYRSNTEHRLRVVDKVNGGSKADAANAGLNIATRPLFCVMDADSVLERRALLRTVQFFLDDKRVVACGGTLRPLNGCSVEDGNLTFDGIPESPLALCQTIEYMRSFLCGRIGWAQLNALLIISGGYGVFRTDAAMVAGGFDHQMIGEDMDLVMRMHRAMLRDKLAYRIAFVPETTCWTEVPETLGVLRNQRARWQRGLIQCLWVHRELFFSLRSPGIGWVAMPFFLLVECLSPIIELVGLILLLAFAFFGKVHYPTLLGIGGVALAMSMLLSTTSLLLDSLTPGNSARLRSTAILLVVIILEPLIYHPLHTWYRLIGIAQWATRRRAAWGTMTRVSRWQAPDK